MHQIMMNGSPVGTVEVIKEGLYFKFFCTCIPPDKEIYRVYLQDGNQTRNLGVCVPNGERYTLNARVAVKHLTGDHFCFFIASGNTEQMVKPVESGKEFPYLDQLENASLQTQNGQQVIMINQYQDQLDNDRNPEYSNESESL